MSDSLEWLLWLNYLLVLIVLLWLLLLWVSIAWQSGHWWWFLRREKGKFLLDLGVCECFSRQVALTRALFLIFQRVTALSLAFGSILDENCGAAEKKLIKTSENLCGRESKSDSLSRITEMLKSNLLFRSLFAFSGHGIFFFFGENAFEILLFSSRFVRLCGIKKCDRKPAQRFKCIGWFDYSKATIHCSCLNSSKCFFFYRNIPILSGRGQLGLSQRNNRRCCEIKSSEG